MPCVSDRENSLKLRRVTLHLYWGAEFASQKLCGFWSGAAREARRRSRPSERATADHWRIPTDLPARGQAYDLARDRANIRISILSPTGLDGQIGYVGATWLDRELASPSRTTLANTGFGRESQRQWNAAGRAW
jgi:hypothetical protein